MVGILLAKHFAMGKIKVLPNSMFPYCKSWIKISQMKFIWIFYEGIKISDSISESLCPNLAFPKTNTALKRRYSGRWMFNLGMSLLPAQTFWVANSISSVHKQQLKCHRKCVLLVETKAPVLEITYRFNFKPIFTFKPTTAKSISLCGLPK